MFSFQFNNLKGEKLFTHVIILCSLFLPGFGYLYLTNISLFQNTDNIKLLLLSLIFSLPLLFVCLIDSMYGENNLHEQKEKNAALFLQDAGIKSILCLYAFIVLYKLNFITLTEKIFGQLLHNTEISVFYGFPIFLTILDITEKCVRKLLKR